MIVLAMAAAAVAAPLAPVGKWNLNYSKDSCILARQYGDAARPVTVDFEAIPLSGGVELLIAEPRFDDEFSNGPVAIDWGGQAGDGWYRSYPTNKAGKHLTRITAERSLFAGRKEPLTATFRLRRDRTFSYRVESSAAAMASLQTCLDKTLVDWGIDPAAEAAIATPARAMPGEKDWLRWTDYPSSAVARGQQGISMLLWKVDAAGHVADCRAVIPSGLAELDKAGCDAITRRGRYTPALDAAGNAVPSYKVRRVVWSTPGGLAGD